MDTIKTINYVIMVLFFACYAYQFGYILIALFKKQKTLPDGKLHRFAVLIAARNEESVIGNLIDSLKQQSYPAEYIAIYVVADNCTDHTANVAHAHGAKVIRRYDRNRIGKGFALHYLLRRIHKSYDAYLVFDADNVVDPDYVREINKTFSAGYDIVTSYRNSKNYGDNWISSGYALWFLREAQYLNRPRALLGVSCGVSGTGFLFSSRILERCGGWNFFLLTEDIEFTAYNITQGEKIGYCPSAVFYDEQPTDFRQSVRQRVRWVQGYMQVLRHYGGRLLYGCLHGSFSCFDMLMNIAPAAILSWGSVLLNLAAILVRCMNGADMLTMVFSVSQSLVNLCMTVFLLGLITTISEWRKIHCPVWQKLLAVLTFPLFMLTYLPVTVAAFICKPGWKPISHHKTMPAEKLIQTAKDQQKIDGSLYTSSGSRISMMKPCSDNVPMSTT